MSDNELPPLGPRLEDRVASIAKGVGALVPHAGPFLTSIISALIPDRRAERLEIFVQALAHKIEDIDENQQRMIASSPEHIDLFEEGAFRAARALSEKRIGNFATIVAIGMTKGTAEALAQKRLLVILSDLDEQDIIMLKWQIERNRTSGGEYARSHPELLGQKWPPTTVFSSREEREEEALRKAVDNKLIRYGLVDLVDDNVPPGMSPRKREQISQLGLLILRTVGLSENQSVTW